MSSPFNRTLAGVSLRPKALDLLDEIEQFFGELVSVRPATPEEQDREVDVAATVDSDGFPEIIASPKHPLTETLIVRELFKFKYPLVRTKFGFKLQGMPIDHYVLSELKSSLADQLVNQQFYPAMRRMGLEPAESLRQHVTYLLSGAPLKHLPQLQQTWYLPLYYYAVVLDTADAALIDRLRRYYEKKRWHDPLKMGMDLVDAAVKAGPDLDSIVSTAIECLNIYYEGEAAFELREIKTGTLGGVEDYLVVLAAGPYESK